MTDTQTATANRGTASGFAALFEASEETTDLGGEGEIVSGIVVQVTRDTVVVDIGGKSEGVISRGEFLDAHGGITVKARSEEHTSELQSQSNLVCRLLLEKKKKKNKQNQIEI